MQTFCTPKGALFRYLGLVLMCLTIFGAQFCYDNPGALQDRFETDLNMSASQFVVLYSVYPWPNVILCFIGGFLSDRVFGVRWATIIYTTVVLCGQLIFATGTFVNTFWIMIVGRLLFGIGSESLLVAQKSYTVLWFKGKALSTVLSLQQSFSQICGTLDSLSMGMIYNLISQTGNFCGFQRIGMVLYTTTIACFSSVSCAFLLSYMDRRAEKFLKKNEEKTSELARFKDVKDFGLIFWLIVLVNGAFYISIFPFVSLGKMFLIRKYELHPDSANMALSLVYGTAAIGYPFVGILIDKTGRNTLGMLIGITCSLLAHIFLAFTSITPYVSVVLLGMSDALFTSSYWPIIAYIVPEHQLGTAYGVTQAFQNLNLAVMSIVSGILVDNSGYFMLELFFLTWVLISLILAIVIWKSTSGSIREMKQINADKPSASKD